MALAGHGCAGCRPLERRRAAGRSVLFVFCLVWLADLFAAPAARAVTRRIPQDYPTIQWGLNVAQTGDTVLVSPGVYAETLTLPSGVTLLSAAGPESTVLQGSGTGAGVLIADGADSTRLLGFTIQGYRHGAVADGGSPRIVGNVIREQELTGVDFSSSSTGMLEGNLISACNIGVLFDEGTHPVVRRNTLVRNGTGVAAPAGAAPLLEANIVALNLACGVSSAQAIPGFSCNDVWGNGADYGGGMPDPTGVDGNVSVDPGFCAAPLERYGLRAGSPCAADSVCGRRGAREVGCLGRVWVVDASGGGDAVEIGEAVEQAAAPDTVLVSPGTYAESVVLAKALVVRGRAGPESTAVDAAAESYGFRCSGAAVDSSAVVAGFTVRGAAQAGVRAESGCEPRLEELVLAGNGRGVVADGAGARLRSVTVTAGAGDGVRVAGGGAATLERTLVSANAGAGVRVVAGSAALRDCDVDGNAAGDFVGLPDPTGTDGNISADPLLCDKDEGVFSLRAGSPCLPDSLGSPLRGALGLGCLGRVWDVAADGSGEAPTIQAAVDSSLAGDTVRVAPGSYAETVLLAPGVSLVSEGGPQVTELALEGAADGIRCAGCDSTSRVSGLSLQGYSGAGMRLESAAGMRVVDCRFAANGAGLGLVGGWALVDSCVFVGNGTGLLCDGGEVAAANDTWHEQGGYGVYVGATSSASLERCIVVGGMGTGIEVASGGAASLACDDVWSNAGGDYVGVAPGSGDFSADPLFCDAGGGDYRLSTDSPCAPEHSGGCGLVGAGVVACGPGTAVARAPAGAPPTLGLALSPCPLRGPGVLRLESAEAPSAIRLSLLDVRGRRIHEWPPVTLPGPRLELAWPLPGAADLAPGVYFLLAEEGAGGALPAGGGEPRGSRAILRFVILR